MYVNEMYKAYKNNYIYIYIGIYWNNVYYFAIQRLLLKML